MLEQSVSLLNSQEENTSENIFSSLIEILRKESVVYQELKSTIIYEKKILKKPILDDLNHNNAIKENIILKARMLAETRTNVLKKLARNFDLSTDGVKLTQLAGYANATQRKEIENIRDELFVILREINALNAVNKNLLDASMSNIKSSLFFINSIMSSESVYLECGKIKSVHRNGTYFHEKG